MKRVVFTAVFQLLITGCAPSAPAGDGGPRDSPTGSMLADEFVEAYNGGSPDALARFIRERYDPSFVRTAYGTAEGAASRLLALYRLYGPVRPHSVQRGFGEPIFWTRGTITRGWLGLQWETAPDGSVTRQVVWRLRPPTAKSSSPIPAEALADSLRGYLSRSAAGGYFSGAVLVARNGDIIFEGAYGEAVLGHKPNTLHTRFNIGSVTKMLTGTAVLRLFEKGVLDLDAPLVRYIAEYPRPAGERVTLRHLLTHTSGIEFDDVPGFVEAVRQAESAADLLAAQLAFAGRAGITDPAFTPAGEFNYSNEGVDLLGVAIERASGRPWTDVVRDEVLRPAGMRHTTFRAERERGDAAVGYTALSDDLETYDPGARRDGSPLLRRAAAPSGQVYSTPGDLHRLLRALLERRLLSDSLTAAMFSAQVKAGELEAFDLHDAYGFTIQISTGYGVTTKGHGGVVPGYSAQVQWYPDLGYEVIVLSNYGDTAAHIVAEQIEDMITPL